MTLEPVAQEGEPLHVHVAWVTDTDQYNEWMDEEDYCIPYTRGDGTSKNPCKKSLLKDVSLSDSANPAPAAPVDDVSSVLLGGEIQLSFIGVNLHDKRRSLWCPKAY